MESLAHCSLENMNMNVYGFIYRALVLNCTCLITARVEGHAHAKHDARAENVANISDVASA